MFHYKRVKFINLFAQKTIKKSLNTNHIERQSKTFWPVFF